MSRMRTGDTPTSTATTAKSHVRRRSAADTSAAAASALATVAAIGSVSASLKVETVNRLDSVRARTGKAARLVNVLPGVEARTAHRAGRARRRCWSAADTAAYPTRWDSDTA